MGSFGTTEIIVIVLIVLILFGGKKIPELMRGLGTGVKEFKKATDLNDDDADRRRSYDRLDDSRTEDRRIEERRLEDRRLEEERRLEQDRRSDVR